MFLGCQFHEVSFRKLSAVCTWKFCYNKNISWCSIGSKVIRNHTMNFKFNGIRVIKGTR